MFINKASENKKLKNNILELANEAIEAKKIDSNVINATTGMFKDESGSLYEFSCVKKVIKTLNTDEKFAYSNSAGSPSFTQAILVSLFGPYVEDVKEECFVGCIPSPGGSGGLNLAFTNYVDKGESVLLPNHMWENYLNYASELEFVPELYSLFDKDGNFDINDLKARIDKIKSKQKRIMILINDPCENPTGFCMTDKDYDALIDIARNNPNNNFIYLLDVAYFIFYSVDQNIIKSRYAKFVDMPSNALTLFVFSGSKAFGLYGLRIGALVELTKDEKEIVYFQDASNFSCRAKWSATSTLGISIIEKLDLVDKYRTLYESEIQSVSHMLKIRSEAFLESAREVGLETLPYESGFFICVPYSDPEKLMKALHEDGVYVICTHSCLRIALCAISKEESKRLPYLIKNRMEKL